MCVFLCVCVCVCECICVRAFVRSFVRSLTYTHVCECGFVFGAVIVYDDGEGICLLM